MGLNNLHFRKITDIGEVTVIIQKPGQTPEDHVITTEVYLQKGYIITCLPTLGQSFISETHSV